MKCICCTAVDESLSLQPVLRNKMCDTNHMGDVKFDGEHDPGTLRAVSPFVDEKTQIFRMYSVIVRDAPCVWVWICNHNDESVIIDCN